MYHGDYSSSSWGILLYGHLRHVKASTVLLYKIYMMEIVYQCI